MMFPVLSRTNSFWIKLLALYRSITALALRRNVTLIFAALLLGILITASSALVSGSERGHENLLGLRLIKYRSSENTATQPVRA